MLIRQFKTSIQFAIILGSTFLAACSSPQTFQAAGVHDGEKYRIEVKRGAETFNPDLFVLLNGEQAMRIPRVNMFKDPNCKKTKISSWRCVYITDYQGMVLKVVEETNTTIASNSLNYDVYLDGDYVQRVVAAMY
ncbi:hypothetical protein OIU14_05315 [Thalassobacter stenotrophicus]|uniref:hypothetical protein n=1 Tax=Thalassobacter stenotrophicus TaxID=266809 RepID=UPI0022A95CCA|nr:hypothetical protein [Thalassobacter stenotrophicus]UYP69151.1 hypothetical protein OIU14_05315 [Thalassobacter stenotrophicus]